MKKKYLTALLLLAGTTSALAQQAALPGYYPTRAEELERYKAMVQLDSVARNKVYNGNVKAHWLPGGEAFWYVKEGAGNSKSFQYVDAVHHNTRPVFDTMKLATAAASVVGHKLNASRLPVTEIVPQKNNTLLLQLDEKWISVQMSDYAVKAAKAPLPDTTPYPLLTEHRDRWQGFETDSVSPNKEWIAYTKDGNVFAKPKSGDGKEVQFTKDGTDAAPYGALAWSPDSKYVVGYHIHPVKDSSIYYILSAVPNTTRGQLKSQQYKQPGDPFTTYEMYVFTLASDKVAKVNTETIDFFDAPVLHWRKNEPGIFLYEKVDRGHQRFRIIEVNAATANTKTILDEKTNTFIYENRIYTEYLPNTNEIIWTSEKDGWRHIYLVDGITGKVKNEVTKGNYVVRGIDSIDQDKREIWFSASGMNAGEDPYFVHDYRIGFDGQHLLALTPAMGNHKVTYSPDKKYYLDTYSQVDVAPVTTLHRTADAQTIMDVEHADTSALLALNIPLPTVFVAKGRDGVTDIWGVMCKPSHFDPDKRYPIIENIYAGPQDAFVPKNYMPYSEMQSMAELGFIVIQVDGMGTANRSKAFHDVCWKNLADGGFADRILWMKALAEKYPFADTSRVGVFGTSAGGQNSAAAVLFHPEFYKAAVSACGCHDNRIDKQWWNEQWMGYPVGKHYEEQSNITNASKLKGSLLLIVGEHDENVPPESTYRFADALIKANKSFDLLTVPGMGHSDGGPFGRQRKRDFFVQHLFNILPPDRNAGDL